MLRTGLKQKDQKQKEKKAEHKPDSGGDYSGQRKAGMLPGSHQTDNPHDKPAQTDDQRKHETPAKHNTQYAEHERCHCKTVLLSFQLIDHHRTFIGGSCKIILKLLFHRSSFPADARSVLVPDPAHIRAFAGSVALLLSITLHLKGLPR